MSQYNVNLLIFKSFIRQNPNCQKSFPLLFQLSSISKLDGFRIHTDKITESPQKYLKEQLDEFEIDEYDQKGCATKRRRTKILICIDIRKPITASEGLIFNIFGTVAQFERLLIQERINAGLNVARTSGRKGGTLNN